MDAILWPSKPSKKERFPIAFNDVSEYNIYGILAAPVCTYFSGSGAKHPRSDNQIKEGLALVDACIRIAWATKPKFWVLENPVGKLRKWLGEPRFSFQPYEFGDPYSKKTLLWGDFNIPVKTPVPNTEGSKLWAKYGGKSDKTKEARSITPPGFAKAFFLANQ